MGEDLCLAISSPAQRSSLCMPAELNLCHPNRNTGTHLILYIRSAVNDVYPSCAYSLLWVCVCSDIVQCDPGWL